MRERIDQTLMCYSAIIAMSRCVGPAICKKSYHETTIKGQP